jgi:hypothetical protein
LAADRCTHFDIYNANPTIAFFCKNINDFTTANSITAEMECNDRQNCRILKVSGETCDSAELATSVVPLTNSDLDYTARTCVEACYNAKAEFANFNPAGTPECKCYEGATACDTTTATGASGTETYEIKCPCYYTTPTTMTAHANTDCGAVDAPNAVTTTTMGTSHATTPTTIVYTMQSCHWECQNEATCQTFSFNTDTNACTLHTATCKISGSDTNT